MCCLNRSSSKTCRSSRFTLTREGRAVERYRFDYCRTEHGWDLTHTPASSFCRDDWQLLEQTLKQTLEDNADGEPVSWTNHRSKRSGVLVPTSHEMRSGMRCRQTAVTIFDGKGQSSNGSYLFCRDESGDWNRLID